jgi:hypothetical protein
LAPSQPEGLLAVTLATGADPWEAAALLVAALPWEAATDLLLATDLLDPFGQVRALSTVAETVCQGPAHARNDFLARLRTAGIHPLSVALGAFDRRNRGAWFRSAHTAIALAQELATDPGTARTLFDAASLFRHADSKPPYFQTSIFSPGHPGWPSDLKVIPVQLRQFFQANAHDGFNLSFPEGLAIDGDWHLLAVQFQALPERLRVAGNLVLSDCPNWDERFPDSATAKRIAVTDLFPMRQEKSPGQPVVTLGGLAPEGWRRFKALEAEALKTGSSRKEARRLAKAAVQKDDGGAP